MSEALLTTTDASGDEWRVNREFIERYQFLARHFPGAVQATERAYTVDGESGYEYLLQVGEPMRASDVFGHGRSLEVGGPSQYRRLRTVQGNFRPTIVTNINGGEGVDRTADASALEFPDNSFAAVMAMYLPYFRQSEKPEPATLHRDFIKEAHRILEPGGMLLMAGATTEDLAQALDMGFGIELGNGCIMARMARLEPEPQATRLDWDIPTERTHLSLEILLHK